MEILERPATFSPVGGRMPNPVVYRIATDSAYVKAVICNAQGEALSQTRASQRQGEVSIDVSGFLRAQMKLTIPAGALTVEPAHGSSVAFYCVLEDAQGNVLDDSANVRHAVAAALPYNVSDYSGYTI
ncbi:hypothetical protein [Pontibacter sp. H249]|uniref:hypothetical protein n=1 Tax=Pontibacter sp. H249 TaxID=3133420 RepID=UPI0030C3AE31